MPWGGGDRLTAPLSHPEGVNPKGSSLSNDPKAGLLRLKPRNDVLAFTLAEGVAHVDIQNRQRKFAFTLAEVLITLGIIGVVAAMTLPALISEKHNRELETALKKYYSVLQQVCMQMYIDEGQTINRLNYTRSEFLPLLRKYFINVDSKINVNGSTLEDAESGTSVYSVKEYKTYNKKTLHGGYLDDGSVTIADSVTIILERPVTGERMFLTVDVNGIKKKPNLWGHDLFTFQVTDEGKLLPMGAEGTLFVDESVYCSPSSSSGINGIGCTARALSDKNFWKNMP